MKHSLHLHSFASALLVLATASALHAQDWYWTGAVSENWSDTGNWNSAADGTGSAPTDILLDFSGKNIMLQGNGTYQPANQDVENLSIKNLMMDASIVSFDMRGAPLTFDIVNNTVTPASSQTIRFYNPLITKSSNGWTVRDKLSLELWGGYGESGGSRSFACNFNGNVHFYGPVTITGGMHHNQANAHYYGIETTGVFPESLDEDYFSTGYGTMTFRLPPGSDFYRYRFPETVGAKTTGTLNLVPLKNVDIVFDGPICGDAGKNVQINESGTAYLNGENTFLGALKPNRGMTVLGGSLAPGGQINSNAGTLDLCGHSVLGRDLTFENGLGVDNNGGIVNSDEAHEATLDGNITKLASNASVAQFGGRGDIRLEGDITDTNGSRLFQKFGTGRLTFAGSSVNPNGFSVRNGTLALDYTEDNGGKIADAANLSLAGCLDLIGNADADSVEILNALNLGEYAAVKIRPVGQGGHATALRASTLKFYDRGTLDIEPSGDGSVGILAPENSVLGILGARAIYGGNSFARAAAEAGIDGYTLVEPLPDAAYTSGFNADSNAEIVDIVANTAISAQESVGAIRFASPSASKLILNANLQILGERQDSNGHNGAILVTSARGAEETVIEGGLIGQNFVNGSLYIHQENDAAPLVIRSRLFNFSSGNNLVKSGPGELRLENPENSFSDTCLLEGTLTATSITNRGSNSAAGQCGTMTIGTATFRYVGDGGESDMSIRSRGASVFDASGTSPLVLTSAQGIQYVNDTGRDSAITFTGTGEGELRGPVAIAYGQVRKQGSGKWTLSCATNILFGGAVVEQGELCVTGFFGRDITVRNGATLSGSPTVQRDLVLESGATLLLDPAAPMAIGCDVVAAEGAAFAFTERLPFDEPITVLTYGSEFTGSVTTDRPGEYRVSCANGAVIVTRKSASTVIFLK